MILFLIGLWFAGAAVCMGIAAIAGDRGRGGAFGIALLFGIVAALLL